MRLKGPLGVAAEHFFCEKVITGDLRLLCYDTRLEALTHFRCCAVIYRLSWAVHLFSPMRDTYESHNIVGWTMGAETKALGLKNKLCWCQLKYYFGAVVKKRSLIQAGHYESTMSNRSGGIDLGHVGWTNKGGKSQRPTLHGPAFHSRFTTSDKSEFYWHSFS